LDVFTVGRLQVAAIANVAAKQPQHLAARILRGAGVLSRSI
jgi:hypothetical protein